MEQLKLNHGAIWVSIIWMFVLGFLWYGPLFGERWMGLEGFTMEEAMANPVGADVWISNVLASAAGIYLLAWLFTKMNISTLINGLVMGVIIGFIFNLLPTMVNNFFAYRPYGIAWITGGFQTVGWGVAGLILGVWTKKG
jgi:hypothetical protein